MTSLYFNAYDCVGHDSDTKIVVHDLEQCIDYVRAISGKSPHSNGYSYDTISKICNPKKFDSVYDFQTSITPVTGVVCAKFI